MKKMINVIIVFILAAGIVIFVNVESDKLLSETNNLIEQNKELDKELENGYKHLLEEQQINLKKKEVIIDMQDKQINCLTQEVNELKELKLAK